MSYGSRALLVVAVVAAATVGGSSSAVGASQPTGVHLSLGTLDDQICVVFETRSQTNESAVEYGLDSSLGIRAVGEQRTFVDGGAERLVR
jgi:hypothetical protein